MGFSWKARGRSLLCFLKPAAVVEWWTHRPITLRRGQTRKKESVPSSMSKVLGGQLSMSLFQLSLPLWTNGPCKSIPCISTGLLLLAGKIRGVSSQRPFLPPVPWGQRQRAVVFASWQQLSERKTALFRTPALVSVPMSFPSKTARSRLAAESQHPREKLLTFFWMEGRSLIMVTEAWFENQEGRPAMLLGASLDMWMARIPQSSLAPESQYALIRSTEMPPPPTSPYAALVPMLLLQVVGSPRE